MRLAISRALLDGLLAATRAAGGREACGLLVGHGDLVLEAPEAPNAASDPSLEFLIDPAFHLCTQRRAREAGRTLLGCWHSHPGRDLRPSLRDEGGEIGCAWLIVAGAKASLWEATGTGFLPAELVVGSLQLPGTRAMSRP